MLLGRKLRHTAPSTPGLYLPVQGLVHTLLLSTPNRMNCSYIFSIFLISVLEVLFLQVERFLQGDGTTTLLLPLAKFPQQGAKKTLSLPCFSFHSYHLYQLKDRFNAAHCCSFFCYKNRVVGREKKVRKKVSNLCSCGSLRKGKLLNYFSVI